MKSELYKAIKAINISNLTDDDKAELLKIFMVTQNILILDQIAFIFSDLHYDKAVPYIFKRINDKNAYNNNGSLVFALEGLNVKRYFISLIRIICEQAYEARLMAYGIVKKYIPSISRKTRGLSLRILEEYKVKAEQTDNDQGENSRLHFIEQTILLLHDSG